MAITRNDVIDKYIRIRFSLPLVALTAGCCLVVFIFSILFINNELNNAMYYRIDVAARVTEQQIETFKADGCIAAMVIANDPQLIEAVKSNDRAKIMSSANMLRAMAQTDFCTILDKDGNVLTRTHEPGRYGDSLAHLPHVKQAMNGKREAYVSKGVTIHFGANAGSPIYDEDMNIIGIVSLGFNLDNQDFVNHLKAITTCEIGIYCYDERVATTLIDEGGIYGLGIKAHELISNVVMAGGSYTGRMKLAQKDSIAKYIPIYGAENEVVGMFGVAYFTAEEINKISFFIISGIIITVGILAVCFLLSRYITKTVESRLGGMMEEVNKADETARAAIEEKNMLTNIMDIMNGLDVMIYVTDPKTGEILFMNESMKRHYSVNVDPVGLICFRVLQEGLNERCAFCPCLKLDKEPDKVVVWDEHNSLTDRIYRNVDRYINWPNKQKVHMQYSVDMTELIAAKEEAESSNRSKGIFLAQMSHEIRTPMNAILGISEIQLQNGNLSIDAEEGYRSIYESGNLLLNIINDILDFSKIDAGKLEIISEVYDIPSLINDTVQLNRLRYEGKPIVFLVNLDEKTPNELKGDKLRIKQILHNLLSNSFKYTDAGEIELSVNTENIDSEYVNLFFRVRDTGQGLTESQISRLFDEYTRFNMDTNRGVSGTGLGMTITKRLVDMMGGEIIVESTPGKGSVFTVRLPQASCDSVVCGPEVSKKLRDFNFRSVTLQNKTQIVHEQMPYGKVLVVDDVESNLIVAKGLLLPYGLQIDTAISGFEAIEKIKSDRNYDVVFMDHMMPKMDGLQTVKILRDMGYSYPIVALTANAVIGQEEMFLENGFDGFISKPIDSRELNYLLIEFIRNKKPQEEKESVPVRNVVNKKPVVSEDLKLAAIQDIRDSIKVLEDILPKINSAGADFRLYTTTVHGLKSALANINENKLSNAAFRLEQAGYNGETTFIINETPELITALQAFIERIEPAKNANDQKISREDLDLLREKLNDIITACQKYIIKDAKTALAGIKQKKWPNQINDLLNEISLCLVRGEFSKVEAAVDKANKVVIPGIEGII